MKEKEEKKTLKIKYILFTGVAIVFIVLSVWCVGRLLSSDLGKFPFESDVWGDVSDYFGIIIGAISVFFIYKTLISQNRAIEKQTESLNHQSEELRLARLSKRKEFNYNIEVTFEDTADGREAVRIKNVGDKINKFKVVFMTNPVIWDIFNSEFKHAKRIVGYSSVLYENQSTKIIFQSPIEKREVLNLIIEDYYGFKYSQIITLSPGRGKSVFPVVNKD